MACLLLVLILFILSLGSAVAEGRVHPKARRSTDVSTSGDGEGATSCPHVELLRGRDGRDGLPGRDGKDGVRGDKGEAGVTGSAGEKGKRGTTGLAGEKGEPGTTGLAGEKGEPGATGLTGEKGEPGTTGLAGEKGEPGETGLAGEKGDPGTTGEKGEPGTTGLAGEKGDPGATGLAGEKGDPGVAGPPGPRSGGVVYTRWGKTSCPNVSGTELVYAGRAGGSRSQGTGGAANYLCMPNDPDYLRYQPGVQGYSPVYGAEYQSHNRPLSAVDNHNAPCAVCYASTRVAVTMIPAKTRCPLTWTLEYSGYFMSDLKTWHAAMFECVDKNPDSVPRNASNIHFALFHHAEANCNGMACPPYDPQKELTCAVCTK